ncbi:UDP-N-acetylglucosamine 2-epimerase [Sphingomonas sp.]|uniref:UDP-N-acetylglucosamine 2-epimerase n=1 Tax=Sphingomonas sp. TaxID=28214 RepID=UPI0025E56C4A|nr:UDP-N-acetylglucosamine 2-epimerase [Sphingomonas sp.]
MTFRIGRAKVCDTSGPGFFRLERTLRKIVYVSGTRADFGLMRHTLLTMAACPDLDLSVLVTGMHLSSIYGHTVDEIEQSGLVVCGRVPVSLDEATGAAMAQNIGHSLIGFTQVLASDRPDIVLLLGDRGEMLAGAIAAIHLNIPVAHVHGGELSGTVDEPVRHAISKLSHLHFTATEASRARLIRMGEREDRIFAVGAPGLDGLADAPCPSRAEYCARYGFDPALPLALFVYHPVLHETQTARADTERLLAVLQAGGLQTLALMPNSDAGSDDVRAALRAVEGAPWIRIETHLPRPHFIAAMATVDVMIGNSSSGIIEAATFGTPVINVGSRQNLRERNGNVIDVPCASEAITTALARIRQHGRYPRVNLYGDGSAAHRISRILSETPLPPEMLMKLNSY